MTIKTADAYYMLGGACEETEKKTRYYKKSLQLYKMAIMSDVVKDKKDNK